MQLACSHLLYSCCAHRSIQTEVSTLMRWDAPAIERKEPAANALPFSPGPCCCVASWYESYVRPCRSWPWPQACLSLQPCLCRPCHPLRPPCSQAYPKVSACGTQLDAVCRMVSASCCWNKFAHASDSVCRLCSNMRSESIADANSHGSENSMDLHHSAKNQEGSGATPRSTGIMRRCGANSRT